MATISITRKIEFTKSESKKIAKAYEKNVKVEYQDNPKLTRVDSEEFIASFLKK